MTRREELLQNAALRDELYRMSHSEHYDAHTTEMYAWRDEVKKLLRRLCGCGKPMQSDQTNR